MKGFYDGLSNCKSVAGFFVVLLISTPWRVKKQPVTAKQGEALATFRGCLCHYIDSYQYPLATAVVL